MKKLKEFTSKEFQRATWMTQIQQINEFAYATDAYIAVRKKGNLTKEPTTLIPKKASDLLVEIFHENRFDKKIYKTETIKKQIEQIKKTPIFESESVECSACDGEGVVDYEFSYNCKTYEIENDCPICNGDGEIETKSDKIKELVLSEMELFKVFENKLISINKLIPILELGETIEIQNTYKDFILCKINNYEIVIMRRINSLNGNQIHILNS